MSVSARPVVRVVRFLFAVGVVTSLSFFPAMAYADIESGAQGADGTRSAGNQDGVAVFTTGPDESGVQPVAPSVNETPAVQSSRAGNTPTSSNNVFGHDYVRVSSTAKSYLYTASNGSLQRVEFADGKLFYETVGAGYQTVSGSTVVPKNTYVPSNLSSDSNLVWGGFFAGANANYVVTGQNNPNESESTVVLRVTKYGKDWSYLGAYEKKGANTTKPFEAGSCSITELGGKLYVRACHEMYKSSDGYNHQANMTYVINESSMALVDEEHEVAWQGSPYGYVSHSFNQYVVALNGQAYGIDHGDAYPRAITIKKFGVLYGGYTDVIAFGDSGDMHYNYTGGTLGGATSSSTKGNLLVVGSFADQTKYYANSSSTAYNVWVAATPTGLLDNAGGQTAITYLTSYAANGKTSASSPFIVKVNDNRFCVIWGLKEQGDQKSRFEPTGKVSYAFVDGSGKLISDVKTQVGVLSDCQPVLHNGKIVWYSTGVLESYSDTLFTAPSFFEIGANDGSFKASIPIETAVADMALGYSYDPAKKAFVRDAVYFNGKNQTPPMDVTYYGMPLVKDKDYSVTYSANRNVGPVLVTITGKSPFFSNKRLGFSILPVGVYDAQVASIGATVYTGNALKPKPKVTLNGVTLIEGTDYTLSYDNNVNAGRGSVTIEGTTNLYGSTVEYFDIKPASLAQATVSGVADATYTGSGIRPVPVLKMGGRTLKENTDYYLSYENNTSAGTATIVAVGMGNYTGSVSKTFRISKADVAHATVSAIADQAYTGAARTPKPKVSLGGKELKEGTDYTLSYKDNVKVGTATVTATGKGNYTGSVSKTFKVAQAKVFWDRRSGKGRYDTMEEIVKVGPFATGGTVVVATGANFKDALAAAGLAGLDRAPVVLVDGKAKALNAQARRQLARLKPSRVYVAGGPAVVTESIRSQVAAAAGVREARRLAGANSVLTSVDLANAGKGRWSNTAVVATNRTFKDALSVAPVAYAQRMPVYLTDGKSLDPKVLSSMKACGITQVVVVGGELAISGNVVSQIRRAGIVCPDSNRIWGQTGVQTSAAIAKWGIKRGMSADRMGVATSQNFPDALAGAALCGINGSVLVLADDKAMANASFPKAYRNQMTKGYVFGGELAVGPKTWNALNAATK